ncbi:MAG: nitroreductase [Clostridiales bacterium]|jgi:nitroreductase|nr:nitroreductase [Clostridiales bacterium]
MNALQAIFERKSMRSYKKDPVPEQALEDILKAGSCAPVAGTFQISVITNPELLKEINDTAKRGMLSSNVPFMVQRASLPGYEPLYGAPVLIVLSSPENSPNAAANTSCAAENMLIAATSLGLGSCYLGSPRLAFGSENGKAMEADAKIPEGYAFNCGVIIGYQNGEAFRSASREDVKIEYVR